MSKEQKGIWGDLGELLCSLLCPYFLLCHFFGVTNYSDTISDHVEALGGAGTQAKHGPSTEAQRHQPTWGGVPLNKSDLGTEVGREDSLSQWFSICVSRPLKVQ